MATSRALIGVYPGTFDPPTTAHLAIARTAVEHGGLARLDFVVSRDPLGKLSVGDSVFGERVRNLERIAATEPWLGVRVTQARLIADISEGYDALVLGQDKWEQVLDPAWYDGSVAARNAALARLPRTLVVPRSGITPQPLPADIGEGVAMEVLTVDERWAHVSSSAVRAGAIEYTAPIPDP